MESTRPQGLVRIAHIITEPDASETSVTASESLPVLTQTQFASFTISNRTRASDSVAKPGVFPTFYIRTLKRRRDWWFDPTAFFSVYTICRQQKPYIVHTHSFAAGIWGRLAAYVAGVPILVHTYGGFNDRQKPFQIVLERFCASLCRYLFFISEESRNEAAQLGIGNNVPSSLINNGIEYENIYMSLYDSIPLRNYYEKTWTPDLKIAP